MTAARHRPLLIAVMALAAVSLAGCETTETTGSIGPRAAAPPPEPPMTHARAASECWSRIEKQRTVTNIDKRADLALKCIEDKLTAVQAAPGHEANARKP